MSQKLKVTFVASLVFACLAQVKGQIRADLGDRNVVTTSVPFLIISPDSRSGGMGDVGVSTTADVNAMHWNASKLAFLEDDDQILSLSYTPWLNRLVPDINLAYLSFGTKISENQAIGASFRYFSLGEINFTDEQGNSMGQFIPNEFAVDFAYALKLSDNFSGAITLRYLNSNLTGGANFTTGAQAQAGQAFAADISGFYMSEEFFLENGQAARISAGFNISNLGNKISYTETGRSDFIPTNMRLGGGFHWELDEYNKVSFHAEFNKLLVPTPPIRNDLGEITAGQEDDVDPISGVFQSFSDAPGGSNEELREIIMNYGIEYWYNNMFALRGGYQWEHETKGGRKYFTMGLGFRLNAFYLDMSYLIPQSAIVRSPIENTLRFTLMFNFDGGVTE